MMRTLSAEILPGKRNQPFIISWDGGERWGQDLSPALRAEERSGGGGGELAGGSGVKRLGHF